MILAKNEEFLTTVKEIYNQDDDYTKRRAQIDTICEVLQLKDRAVIQALVRMKIYSGKPKAKNYTKIELAEEILIELKYDATINAVKSLSHANKDILKAICERMEIELME